jgi:hypothetical protein
MLVGTAWAAGESRVRLAQWLAPAAPSVSSPAAVAGSRPPRAVSEAPLPTPTEHEVLAPLPPEVPSPPLAARDPHAPPSPAPAASGPTADSLYAIAHDLHFRAKDPARALDAWDRYLGVAPKDAHAGLVLEARYNRAICLLRLGRRAEARDALRPFADGAWGDYRRQDARGLLETMGEF